MAITITSSEKQILQSVNIPPRPEALLLVSEEAKKPEPDLQVIAKTIASDISISAAVLQVVNSAAFRRAKEIESIQQAVMTLGLKRLLPLVKSVALKSAMGEADKLAKFWEEANLVASSASIVARLIDKPNLSDNAYMLGLFHNAGIPIMMLIYDDFDNILQFAQLNGWDKACEKEREQYQTSHTTISALLAQKWKLPAIMSEVIYYQHDTDGLFSSGELPDLGLDLMCILKIARSVIFEQANTGQQSSEWVQIEDDVLARLNVDEDYLEDLRQQVMDELAG